MADSAQNIVPQTQQSAEVDGAELTAQLDPNDRLPVLETVSKAYLFLFHHGRELLRLIWPLAVVEFVGLWGYFLHRDLPPIDTSMPKQAAYLMVAIGAAIPMIARVQRFALDPHAAPKWLDFHFGKDDLLILGAMMVQVIQIAIVFLIVAIAMVALTDIENGVLSTKVFAMATVAAIAMSVLISRSLMIYPATLTKGSIAWRTAWNTNFSHLVRILLIWAFATVPFRLIYRLADIASNHIWANVPDPIFLKTLIYLGAIILPCTLSVLAQIIVTFVALTISYNAISGHSQ